MSTNIKSSVSKNIFTLLFGQAANLLLSLLGIVIGARYLGVDQFGKFSYLIAIVAILSKIIDAGIGPIIFRETSSDISNHDLINLGIFYRSGLLFAVYLIFNVSAFFLKMKSDEIIFLNILLAGIIISSKYMNFRDILEIPFKISLKMHYPMIFNILDNLIFLVLVFLIIYLKAGLIYFIIIYVISNLPGFIFLIYFLSKKFNYRLYYNPAKLKWLFRESVPIFGYAILSTIFVQADIIMLKYLGGDYSAGIYAGATRLSLPLAIIPAAIISSVFSLLVKNAKLNNHQNNKINSISLKLLFQISFFIALVFSFKKTDLTILIFGVKYIESSTPSELLLWGNIFLFINFYALDLFTAYNKQVWNFYYSIVVVVINIAINFILIPLYSYNGAAISKIITGIFATGLIIYYLNKLKASPEINIYKLILMVISVTGLLFIVSYLPLVIYVPLTVIIFISTTILTKFFTSEELDFILSQFGMSDLSIKFRKFYY